MSIGPGWTFDLVVDRLAEAGGTMMRLQVSGVAPAQYRSGMPQYLPDAQDVVHLDAEAELRPRPPGPREVSRMDQALSWIKIVPGDMLVHRRIVGSRCLTSWRTGKPLFSWRLLGQRLDMDHKTVKAWHDLAIRIIVVRLNQPGLCVRSGGPIGPGPAVTKISKAQLDRAVKALEARMLAPV